MDNVTPSSDELQRSINSNQSWCLIRNVSNALVHVILARDPEFMIEDLCAEVLVALRPIVEDDPALQITTLADTYAVRRLQEIVRGILDHKLVDRLRRKGTRAFRLTKSLEGTPTNELSATYFPRELTAQEDIERCRRAIDQVASEDADLGAFIGVWLRAAGTTAMPSIGKIAAELNISSAAAYRRFQEVQRRIRTLLDCDDTFQHN